MAWRFQEVLVAAVHSFSNEKRPFDVTKSSREQLRQRILELRISDERLLDALNMQSDLTEAQCLDICQSLRPEY